MKNLCRALLTAAFIAFVAPSAAHAASQEITITPTSASPVIAPGATVEGSLQVINQGQTDYPYTIYSAPYRVLDEDYTPDFTQLPDSVPADKWFSFSGAGGNLKAGQTTTIHYTIHVPENIAPGGYYATVFAQTAFPEQANSITLNKRVGEIFYIKVDGTVTEKGALLNWSANFLQEPPIVATVRLANTGGVHYPATLQVDVRDIFGQSKYNLDTTKEILPQTVRKIPIPWNNTPFIGIFQITGNITMLGQTQQLPAQWVFVMSMPAKIGFVILLIIIAAVVWLRFVARKRKSKKAKR
jgi:hypothetical protein